MSTYADVKKSRDKAINDDKRLRLQGSVLSKEGTARYRALRRRGESERDLIEAALEALEGVRGLTPPSP